MSKILREHRLKNRKRYNNRLRELRAQKLKQIAKSGPRLARVGILDIAARWYLKDQAKAIGVRPRTVALWLSGVNEPGFLIAMAWARFLEITPGQLEQFLRKRRERRKLEVLAAKVKRAMPGIKAAYLQHTKPDKEEGKDNAQ
jgi:transcriptional regulator with XRE-family HTH domain